jgi:glycosyltransferase involved in cell wall biosynthesis
MLAEVARRSHEFDVIHNHHDHWMLPLTEMTATPTVTTLHGRLDVLELCLGLRAFPKARFISISHAQRNSAPDLDWMDTIYHGIDIERHHFRPTPGKYLAFLGRISREKRPDLAIEIAHRAGIPLKIAAKIEGPEMQTYYDRLIKPHVDGKNVEFIGEICDEQRDEFLGEALGLVFPIDWPEPFGLVVVESMACGTPVLARPCGAVSELIENNRTGFYHSDVRVLAQCARDLIGINRSLCRRRVEERFSLKRMTEDYLSVYRTLSEPSERKRTHPQARRRGERALRPRLDRHRRHFIHPYPRIADGDT